jgi:choline kinase
VILAAGRGSRLPGTLDVPKPLATLLGRPLIQYTFEALRACAVPEVLVVTGYRGLEVRDAAARSGSGLSLSFVTNAHWDAPASTSLRAAESWCGDEPFLLLMSDHVPSPAFLGRFLAAAPAGLSSVAADFSEHDERFVAEATLLALEGGRRVTTIGKGLPHFDAIDAGVFRLVPSAWDAVHASPERCELSAVFGLLARTHGLEAVDISGTFWYDIDTAEDLAAAAALLAERGSPGGAVAGS